MVSVNAYEIAKNESILVGVDEKCDLQIQDIATDQRSDATGHLVIAYRTKYDYPNNGRKVYYEETRISNKSKNKKPDDVVSGSDRSSSDDDSLFAGESNPSSGSQPTGSGSGEGDGMSSWGDSTESEEEPTPPSNTPSGSQGAPSSDET